MERYKLNEVNSFRFYQIPKELFSNSCYRCKLNSDAKLVYGLLLDRMHLSEANGWCNDNKEIFLIYTKEDIAEMLGISEKTVYKAFKLLVECELIYQERQGLNKPNKIYIGKIEHNFMLQCKECSGTVKSTGQDIVKVTGQEMYILQGNNTEKNNTEKKEKERLHHLEELNDDYLSFYFSIMKEHGYKQKKVTLTNFFYVQYAVEEFKNNGVTMEYWTEAVNDHFERLAKGRDGDILLFLKASTRYFGVVLQQLD